MADNQSCGIIGVSIDDIKRSICSECPKKKKQIGFNRDVLLCEYDCWILRAIDNSGVPHNRHSAESVFADDWQYSEHMEED